MLVWAIVDANGIIAAPFFDLHAANLYIQQDKGLVEPLALIQLPNGTKGPIREVLEVAFTARTLVIAKATEAQ